MIKIHMACLSQRCGTAGTLGAEEGIPGHLFFFHCMAAHRLEVWVGWARHGNRNADGHGRSARHSNGHGRRRLAVMHHEHLLRLLSLMLLHLGPWRRDEGSQGEAGWRVRLPWKRVSQRARHLIYTIITMSVEGRAAVKGESHQVLALSLIGLWLIGPASLGRAGNYGAEASCIHGE